MKKIAIVVQLDKSTSMKATELSSALENVNFSLALSNSTPHISLCHLTDEVCDSHQAIANLTAALATLTIPGLITGILSDIVHVREKWIFWNIGEHYGLRELQKQIYQNLGNSFTNEELTRAYPYQDDAFSPHITLGASSSKIATKGELKGWVGCEISVVSLGDFGEIIETFATRNVYADQISHLIRETIPEVSKYHSLYSKETAGAYRKHDKKTPYGVHPALCALTILHEKNLGEAERLLGATILAYHDVLEDTDATLPPDLPCFIVEDIEAMCFESSSNEMEEIWTRPDFIQMLKLYDKWSNLYDSSMNPLNKEKYRKYAKRLSEKVKEKYPNLNIHAMIDAVVLCN